jgi:hypothetical protein
LTGPDTFYCAFKCGEEHSPHSEVTAKSRSLPRGCDWPDAPFAIWRIAQCMSPLLGQRKCISEAFDSMPHRSSDGLRLLALNSPLMT